MKNKNFDTPPSKAPRIAVVIPCYKVTRHILGVIGAIGPDIWRIYIVDDCCPDRSGDFAFTGCNDPRLIVLKNPINLGVGGAVMHGYRAAIKDGADIIVKIDGDGQMNPGLIPNFIGPIVSGEADYTKGNRFFYLDEIKAMPKIRLFGNAILSLMTKLSSGYWNLFDPTNGFTAIHAAVASHLPFEKISNRYFFESDMLFRLNTIRAVAVDVPMDAKYSDEVSNLKISKIIGEFFFKHIRNFTKRIFYNYYLRDMSLASIELPIGIFLLAFGSIFGAYQWSKFLFLGMQAPLGTVMLSVLPILVGFQFVMSFIAYDIASVPSSCIHAKIYFKPEKIL